MFWPTRRPSSGLQSFKRLIIVCVWRMLRSHHLAYKIYMRHKLRVSSGCTTIQNILYNNAFPIHHENPPTTLQPPPNITRVQMKITPTHAPTQKWATFTYVGRETTFITNLFKKTDIKIAFRTNNTIQKLLMHKQQTSDIHSRSIQADMPRL